MKSPAYYLRRMTEIGIGGVLSNAFLSLRHKAWAGSQSIWWGMRSRRPLGDPEFLSKTTGKWDSVQSLLRHLANRPGSSFVFPHDAQSASAALFKEKQPEYVANVISTADAICRNEIHLLGQTYRFPQGVDWHTDPVSGFQWPFWHRSWYVSYLYSARRSADLIVYWELNRHHFLITLGIAYWLTNDVKYVNAFGSLTQNWIEKNPLQHGMNWYYPLEVSIRLLAWTAAFQFFRASPAFMERCGSAFIKSLWQQADFLSGHLQIARTKKDTPNNHLIAELSGLFVVASAFPEFASAQAWRETALQFILQQADGQVYPDGMHREQAIGYHRFVLELMLLVLMRCKRDALPQERDLAPRLEKMLEYLLFSVTPAGTVPTWGDTDYGKALGLGLEKDFWDVRPLLSTGAALFNRADMKYVAQNLDPETLWLLGPDASNQWDALRARAPESASGRFPHGGMYIIRDSWSPDTDVAYFRCGPFGLGGAGYCAHAHCDLLSLVLWINGQPLLVDSGAYMYSGEWRGHFRLTHSHNTVMVDGVHQGDPKRFFGWTRVSNAECDRWDENSVSGRMTPVNGVELRRRIFHPQPGVWELTDNAKCEERGAHRLEWFFHLAPGLEVVVGEHVCSIVKDSRQIGTISIPDGGVRFEKRSAWFSYDYGVKLPNAQIYAVWEGELTETDADFQWRFDFTAGATDTGAINAKSA